MRKKEDANFTLDYDFSKLNGYYVSNRTGKINLLTKITFYMILKIILQII